MRLNQVTLPSRDVERGAAFYRAIGLVQIVEALPRYARFEVPEDGATLSLHLVDEAPRAPGAIVYFECDDLDARVEALRAAGIAFESGPVDQPWLWRESYLRDPDGNLLCLFHAGSDRLHPPWRLPAPR